MSDLRRQRGRMGEDLAAGFLQQRGIKILDRNFRCPLGEIDIVGRLGERIVFVEVRLRSDESYGLPQESLSRTKQKRLTRLAQWYLKEKRLEDRPARFDVVAVTLEGSDQPVLDWIPDAISLSC